MAKRDTITRWIRQIYNLGITAGKAHEKGYIPARIMQEYNEQFFALSDKIIYEIDKRDEEVKRIREYWDQSFII